MCVSVRESVSDIFLFSVEMSERKHPFAAEREIERVQGDRENPFVTRRRSSNVEVERNF